MIETISSFEFLRPFWLLLLPTVALIWFLQAKTQTSKNQWHKYIDANLIKALGELKSEQKSRNWLSLVTFLVMVIVLAGPSIASKQKVSQGTNEAAVIIYDLSLSMLANDVKPNRLINSRRNVIDLLENRIGKSTALVVYSGSAHVLTPLSTDIENLKYLLSEVEPTMMPLIGSRPSEAFILADNLFKQANVAQGHIYFVTDGIEESDINKIKHALKQHKLDIIAVGTKRGGPLLQEDGSFIKDNSGNTILAKLPKERLEMLANKSNSRLFAASALIQKSLAQTEQSDLKISLNKDIGIYFVVLLILGWLIQFRQLSLIMLFVCFTPLLGFANDRWDAQKAYEQGNFETSNGLLQNIPDSQKTAKDWQNQALNMVEQKKYKQALEQFEKSRELQPNENLDLTIEALKEILRRQEQQKQNAKSSDNSEQQENQDPQQDQEQSGDKSEEQSGEQENNEQQEQTESQAQENEEQPSQQDSQAQEDAKQKKLAEGLEEKEENSEEDLEENKVPLTSLTKDSQVLNNQSEQKPMLYFSRKFEDQLRQQGNQRFVEEGPQW